METEKQTHKAMRETLPGNRQKNTADKHWYLCTYLPFLRLLLLSDLF
jgi:hypothetical protein